MLKRTRFLVLLFLISNFNIFSAFRTTLQKNDPNPLYTTAFPFTPLYGPTNDYLDGRSCCFAPYHLGIAFTPFFQRATKGTNYLKQEAELGDLTGRWNMIAVLPYNVQETDFDSFFDPTNLETDLPTLTCQTANVATLTTIRNNVLQGIEDVFLTDSPFGYPNVLKSTQGLLSLQTPRELLGFFKVPIDYRKYGVRFEFSGMICKGLGFTVDIGVSNIQQVGKFIDMSFGTTCNQSENCLTSCSGLPLTPLIDCLNPFNNTTSVTIAQWQEIVGVIHTELMDKLHVIAKAINLDLCQNYNKTSLEDIHAEIFGRQAFKVNYNRSKEWPRFLFVPFFQAGGTLATAKKLDDNLAFAISSGDNGFNSVTFLAGFDLDFERTIEVGAEAGFNHYFKRTVDCMRMPTNYAQNGIIPYKTEACVKPGDTWHMSIFMASRYFVNHVSFWGQYVYINHNKDEICIGKDVRASDVDLSVTAQQSAFMPCVLECKSSWNAQILNFGLNYDVSPNFELGLLVQLPLARTNAYRSSTFLLSLNTYF